MNSPCDVPLPRVLVARVVLVVHVALAVAVLALEQLHVVHAVPAIRHLKSPQTINNVFEKGISFVTMDRRNYKKELTKNNNNKSVNNLIEIFQMVHTFIRKKVIKHI